MRPTVAAKDLAALPAPHESATGSLGGAQSLEPDGGGQGSGRPAPHESATELLLPYNSGLAGRLRPTSLWAIQVRTLPRIVEIGNEHHARRALRPASRPAAGGGAMTRTRGPDYSQTVTKMTSPFSSSAEYVRQTGSGLARIGRLTGLAAGAAAAGAAGRVMSLRTRKSRCTGSVMRVGKLGRRPPSRSNFNPFQKSSGTWTRTPTTVSESR